jgi:pimeloyl-ACP methyl ester carboxylesterase
VLKELLANVVLIPVWPLFLLIGGRYQRRRIGSAEATRGRPVILLHGYLMNRTNWVWLGRTLARRGLGPLYGLSYLSTAGSERAARRLARFIEQVCTREGADSVDIVAHSMGGLVARRYIEQMDGGLRVRRLITIGTPHRGTGWARMVFGPAGRDLAPPLSTVGGHGQEPIAHSAPEGVLYTSIWSRCDNLVMPPESAQLTPRPPEEGTATDVDASGDRLDDVVFDDLGHLSLLVSPRVADAVATRLSA